MKVLTVCVLLSGCALTQPPPKPADAPLGPGEVRSALAAEGALAIGRSTKSDVRAALGEGNVVSFDSGYEVWVYRQPAVEKAPAAELVLLFEPAGVLSRTRVR